MDAIPLADGLGSRCQAVLPHAHRQGGVKGSGDMALNATDHLHLNAAAGHLRLGDAMDDARLVCVGDEWAAEPCGD